MSIYLLKETRRFRADSQLEGEQIILVCKQRYNVISSKLVKKEKRDDLYYLVEVVCSFNDEREPMDTLGSEDI